jgi:hypothetical protein
MWIRTSSPCVTLALCVVLTWAATASASIVSISPSGTITKTGTMNFTTGEGTISCPMTLGGTYNGGVSGTLTAAPEPRVNPQIGRITSVTRGTCTGGEITILNRDIPKWEYGHNTREPEKRLQYELPYEILISQNIINQCLYRIGIYYVYNSANGQLTYERTNVLTPTTALFPGVCPASIRVEGLFTVSAGGRSPVMTLA